MPRRMQVISAREATLDIKLFAFFAFILFNKKHFVCYLLKRPPDRCRVPQLAVWTVTSFLIDSIKI